MLEQEEFRYEKDKGCLWESGLMPCLSISIHGQEFRIEKGLWMILFSFIFNPQELEMYKSWCKDMDEGKIPPDMKSKMEKLEKKLVMPGDERQSSAPTAMEDDDEDDVDSDEDDDSEEFDDEEEDEEAQEKPAPGGSN